MLKHFLRNKEGNTFLIVAFGMMAVVGSVGVAVDIGRSQLVQAKLQNAVDSAGLAAGASANSGDLTAIATKYVQANFGTNNLDATLNNVTAVMSNNNKILTISASATLPTTIMKIFNNDAVTVDAQAEITRANLGLELAMVLDTTGSMAGSKIAALRSASNTLLDILYGNSSSVSNLWVGIVPFSQSVNIDTSRTNWLVANPGGGWGGCVQARFATGRDITDDPPYDLAFPNQAVPNAPYERLRAYTGGNCPTAITPLTNVKATLQNGINALAARGATHINFGSVWGWRLISPRWRGYWGGTMNTSNLPLNYGAPLMNKAVIIMTDGENTVDTNTAYPFNSNITRAQLNTKTTAVCNAMKAQGIIVYTVLFQQPSTTVQNLMRSCATSPDHFFNSPTNASLQTAFAAIADSLANLRISR